MAAIETKSRRLERKCKVLQDKLNLIETTRVQMIESLFGTWKEAEHQKLLLRGSHLDVGSVQNCGGATAKDTLDKLRSECQGLGEKLDVVEAVKVLLTESFADTMKELERIQLEVMEWKRRSKGQTDDGQTEDLFDRLPDEMLEKLIGNLKDPKDLVSCLSASMKLNKILKPSIPTLLSKEVVPHVLEFLEAQDILSCRLVSQEWKMLTDQCLEETPLEKIRFSSEVSMNEFPFSGRVGNDVPINPFVGKIVEFEFGNINAGWKWADRLSAAVREGISSTRPTFYWSAVQRWLRQVGMHIENCHILTGDYRCGNDDADNRNVKDIGMCLNELPNVRRLTLGGFDKKSNAREIRLKLPELPQLHHLFLNRLPGSFVRLLISKYSQQLQSLEVTSDYDFLVTDTTYNDLYVTLPHLTKLAINIGMEFEDLSSVSLMRCPNLVALKIFIGYSEKVTFLSIFQAMQQFNDSLQSVVIEFANFAEKAKSNHLRSVRGFALSMFFPRIKSLKLKNVLESFDFLLDFPSLENLTLEFTNFNSECFAEVGQDEVLEIFGFIDRMYQSNVWILLPSLKGFEFICQNGGRHYYSRDGYNAQSI